MNIRRPLGHRGCGIALLESIKNQLTSVEHLSFLSESYKFWSFLSFDFMIHCFDLWIIQCPFLNPPSSEDPKLLDHSARPPLAKKRCEQPVPPLISRLAPPPKPSNPRGFAHLRLCWLILAFLVALLPPTWRNIEQKSSSWNQHRPR